MWTIFGAIEKPLLSHAWVPPTQLQVAADFEYYAKAFNLSTVVLYGGTQYGPQEGILKRGVDVVIGTPGRVKDHLERGTLNLSKLR